MPQSVPSALGLACAADSQFEKGVLRNANRGGENVHSGCIIGAILGAQAGLNGLPARLVDGLKDSSAIRAEIDAFVAAISGVKAAAPSPE